jgi:gliding motility-associated lipoprotein GldH
MKLKFFLLPVILFLIVSCSHNDIYLQYFHVNEAGWNKDSICTFDIQVDDSTLIYNVYVNIRNRGEYPYQNMWLFLKKMSPDSVITKDTIEFYLANDHGKWLGSGVGSTYEMPVLYKQKIKFPRKGIYRYSIVHGMRDSVLSGINDVGMRVEKVINN